MRESSSGCRLLVVALHFCAVCALSMGCDTTYVDSVDHMNEGIRHYNNNQISKALQELKEAVRIYPENHRAHYQLGMIYNGRLTQYEDAIEAFSKAAQLRDDNSEYWYFLGQAHQNAALRARDDKDNARARDHFVKAKEALGKAAQVDKYYAEAWYRLGQVHEQLGELSQAIDAYSNAIQADQTFAHAYLQLGNLYGEYAFLDEATRVLRNGVANNPENVRLQGELGQVYLDKESYLEAIGHFDKAFKIHDQKKGDKMDILPSYQGRAIAHEELGTKAMLESNIAEAVKHYEEATGFYKVFIENANDDALRAQRMQASAAMLQIDEWLPVLRQGELPKSILDQRQMLDEQAAGQNQ